MIKQWKYCLAILWMPLSISAAAQLSSGTDLLLQQNPALFHDSNNIPQSLKSTPFVVGNIYIKGNKKTKPYIILRELGFKKGDSINLPELVKAFSYAHNQLVNTLLFTDVVVFLKGFRGYEVDVEIDLHERWYIIPVPYFKPVDRNLTVWQDYGYSLSRVNYGLKYMHNNFTGRNDNTVVWLVTGYSRQAEIAYDQPNADNSLKHGFGFTLIYSANKQIDALTKNNQQYFINADTIPNAGKYLSERVSLSLRYYYRPAIRVRHLFRVNLVDIKMDSTVSLYNPHFLNHGKRELFFPEASYQVDYTNVDYIAYPLKGVMASGSILKRGLNADMNLWQLNLESTESKRLAHKTYFSTQNMVSLKWPLDQPFYNQQLFGYGNFYLRGLEKYVIDGTFGFAARNTLLRELFYFSLPANIPFLGLYRIPFRVMAKTYLDAGYVRNNNATIDNTLSNKFLYTGGVGIDVVTSYDFVFRVEYSFNQLGEKGLFLHIHNDF